ncbi:ABC transporter permease [Tessaracoccus palaemonis]|uniref:ABC transporter permease n=1 Tax=Tessaracoccus palaemonis TaxID=2829499 RepID=A0ABX8SJZ0_9ACTN|nr:ABC transporter permease [Tessaracoccus palaemonis]QXT63199.1 ABC transporter permease [Tessaracoccus palaemonis]
MPIVRRIAQALLVILLAFTATFILMQALPGDGVLARYQNPELGLTPEQIEQLRVVYGVDQPVWSQFLTSVGNYLAGNFGTSLQSGARVADLIVTALPETLVLAAAGFTLAVIVAVAIAFLASFPSMRWLRNAVRSLPPLFVSVPAFWVGILLIQVFSFGLGWVRVIGADGLEALILPAITLSVPISAPLSQVLIQSLDEVGESPYVAIVRSRGAGEWWVLTRNVAKNALLPTITIAGLLFGELVAGAVVTEAVFGRAGIGTLTEQAVANRDLPVIQAVVLLAAIGFVVINLVVDLLYPVIDPRLRRERTA